MLTEHGLAWLEARLGIEGCVKGPKGNAGEPVSADEHRRSVARRAAAIDRMAGDAYGRADAITTVCEANAKHQRRRGAPPLRSSVIANAVGIAADAEWRPRALSAPTIGLVGRVVPIKDLSTFIRACRAVADELPAARFVVVGPLDHDPAYADRCQALAADLDLGERLQFTGETDPRPWYSRLDVAVLTSVSEAQPLCLIEAMAAGVPVVSTAIGGCADLVRGDREPVGAGRAGLLTPTRDPAATAGAVLRLCRDPQLRWRLSRAGQARARASHNPERFLAAYRALYELAIDQRSRTAVGGPR
ncbi:MAG: GT4 family glycosyltransferase PelF [Solirubrobacterales bacterium]|nr:GT4 family glycosyltransferase PelF [Solirubrobacterales bacterium]